MDILTDLRIFFSENTNSSIFRIFHIEDMEIGVSEVRATRRIPTKKKSETPLPPALSHIWEDKGGKLS